MLASVFGVLFDGFAYGMLLFLLSVGLSVTLGMMNFVNLAHCAFAHARRLRHRDADEQSAAGRSWRRCRSPSSRRRWSASCSSARSTAGSTARAISTRCLLTIGLVFVSVAAAAYVYGTDPAAGADAGLSARLGARRAASRFGAYRLFLIAFALVDHRCCSSRRSNTRASARRCAPRSTTSAWRAASASTSTARSRSPSRSAAGLPGLGGALAIEIVGLDPSFALHLPRLRADRGRRSAGSARSAARSPPPCCSASATWPASTTFPELGAFLIYLVMVVPADVAARRPVREALMTVTSAALAGPHQHLEAQVALAHHRDRVLARDAAAVRG